LHFYVQEDVDSFSSVARYLTSLIKQDIVFKRRKLAEFDVFGFDARDEALQQTRFHPISHTNVLVVGYKGVGPKGETGRVTSRNKDGVTVNTIDPTDPAGEGTPAVTIPDPSRTAITLKQAIGELNKRSN